MFKTGAVIKCLFVRCLRYRHNPCFDRLNNTNLKTYTSVVHLLNQKFCSMKRILAKKKVNNIILEIENLNNKAWELNRINPQKSIELSNKAISIAEEFSFLNLKAISQLICGTAQVWISDYEEALKAIIEAKIYFNKTKNHVYEAKSCYSLGSCYYYLADYEESLKAYFSCLELYKDASNIEGQAEALNGIGSVYYEIGDYKEAFETLTKSYQFLENSDQLNIKLRVIHGLGEASFHLNDIIGAENYFNKGIELCKKHEVSQVLVFLNEGLALLYKKTKVYSKAHIHVDLALDISKQIGFKIGLANNLFLKGEIFLETGNENDALYFFYQSMHIAEEIDNIEIRAKFHEIMSEFYDNRKNYELLCYHLKKSKVCNEKLNKQKYGLHLKSMQIKMKFERLEKENDIFRIKNEELKFRANHLKKSNQRIQTIAQLGQEVASKLELEELLNLIYKQINTLMRADILYIGVYDEKNNQINFPFYIRDKERVKGVTVPMNHKGKFTVWCIKNKKEVILNDFSKEASSYITLQENKKNERLPSSVLIIPVKIKEKIIGVIGVHSYKQNSFKQDKVDVLRALGAYVSIALENARVYKSINDLYGLIEYKNQEILSSITYSQRLQQAILPTLKTIRNVFPYSFVLYKPKDLVAGDFYWFRDLGKYTVFAVADCTGHGVPGALVSMVCSNTLNQVVTNMNNLDAGLILDKTRELVIEQFDKSDEEVKDGMDIALCVYDKESNKLQYAGANNSLWVISENNTKLKTIGDRICYKDENEIGKFLLEIKPNKQPVGKVENPSSFTTHNLDLLKGDAVYLFTDGYFDQFGGEKGKKIKPTPTKQILLQISDLPINYQQQRLDQYFENWKKGIPQVDDVCVMGLKV